MERSEEEDPERPAPQSGVRLLLPSREFVLSRKGLLLLAEAGLSFIIFICFIASKASSFLTVPLLTFLLALCFFFAYSLKLNEKVKTTYWLLAYFLCCVVAAVIYFAISIAAVSKYSDGAAKAAGVFGFIATIVYAVDFYLTFNGLVTSLKQSDSSEAPEQHRSEAFNLALKRQEMYFHIALHVL
ncbi:UNVERIFIED_CONTAM: CKLF-like MARVEL transmembrane domain-containing protein 3 [Gekko kuhli]